MVRRLFDEATQGSDDSTLDAPGAARLAQRLGASLTPRELEQGAGKYARGDGRFDADGFVQLLDSAASAQGQAAAEIAAGSEGGAAAPSRTGGPAPAIRRFKDFTGRWHEADMTGDEVAVYTDNELSTEMKFYNVMVKGSGFGAWAALLGAQLSLWPSGVPGGMFVCAASAGLLAIPPTYYHSLKLRRELERHIYKITVPANVAASMAISELEIDGRQKDHVAGLFNWVTLEQAERERVASGAEASMVTPASDMVDHEKFVAADVETVRRGDQVVTVPQYELLDKLHAELTRPLSGMRAELGLPAIVIDSERRRINAAIARLAVHPDRASDLATFLRWWSRTKVLFAPAGLSASSVDWDSYDPWGGDPPPAPEPAALTSCTLWRQRWIGASELVTVSGAQSGTRTHARGRTQRTARRHSVPATVGGGEGTLLPL